MITLSLKDPHLSGHAAMVRNLRSTGMFTDEEIQKMYDLQIEKDAKDAKGGDNDACREEVRVVNRDGEM